MKRSIPVVAVLLLLIGLAAGCARDGGSDGETRVSFAVESRESVDGEFPPGADRAKLAGEAAGLLVQRLSDNGVADPKATVEGESIVVSARASRDDIVALAATGSLRLRPVLFTAAAVDGGSGLDIELRQANPSTPAAEMARRAQQLTCSGPDPLAGGDDPEDLLVTCAVDGKAVYSLGPVIIDGTEIGEASATKSSDGQWRVNLSFTGKAKDLWPTYTAQNIGKQVAFVLDSRALSAPAINAAIPGQTEISGNFSETEAKHLATVLKSGALPVRLVPKQ